MSDDYRVGRGKPPLATRFQKGRSGNPNGRPRKAGNDRLPGVGSLDSQLLAELLRPTSVTIDGSRQTLSVGEIVLRQQAKLAAQGHRLAAKDLMNQASRAEAALREERQASYAYWRTYVRQHRHAPLNWPSQPGCAPLYPHPRDIIPDPATLGVSFVGPMLAEEAQHFLMAPLLRNYLLRLAERQRRRHDPAGATWLRQQAVAVHGDVVPSCGGPRTGDAPDLAAHGLAAQILDIAAQPAREIDAAIQRLRDRLVSLLPPQAVPRADATVAPSGNPRSRSRRSARRSAIARDPALRAQLVQALARGASLSAILSALDRPAPSRAALGRYAQRYRRTVATLMADLADGGPPTAALPPGTGIAADIPALLRMVRAEISGLADRDRTNLEQLLRSDGEAQQRLEPVDPPGASEAQIDVIRRKILGLDS